MKIEIKNWAFIPITLIAILIIIGFMNAYNSIQSLDENQSASASEVINQYKRRSDLIEKLANVVKGYAQHEQAIFSEISSSRNALLRLNINPEDLKDPSILKKFEAAQSEVESQLKRLLITVEGYPELKSNTLFRDFMVQLEGTENRIAVARNRYIISIRDYNKMIRSFPHIIIAKALGYTPIENLSSSSFQQY